MRRSVLFIPGNNPAMLQNADVFGSDGVIFDLEDAVNVVEKDNARNLIHYYLQEHSSLDLEVIVRINGLDTEYYLKDLEMIVSDSIDSIMLPKARVAYLEELDILLTKIEKEKKLKKKIKIIPIIELAISVLEVDKIASMSRVDGILLGAEDLSSDMEVVRTKQGREIEYARSRVAMACKAYQIDAIDTPFTDVTDSDGLKNDCLNAQSLGMNAKSAIHPNQIDTINEVFMPTKKSIDWALRVQKATEEASLKGIGVFSLDGKMVDKPVIERANKILAKAKKFGAI
jgi:citrate lyase subunit beta / citryl-CoA lyase